MKPLRLVLVSCLFFIFANAAFAQSRLVGKVVEILDGKTVVIELQTGNRITAELQSIETPLPEQPLYQTIKQHLQNLVLDKVVEFRANGMNGSKAIGKLYLGGTDIAMQLVRDGAAWYAAAANTSIDGESEIYKSNQLLAQTEKRGIWSIERMKPPKEFKEEVEAEKREAAIIRAEVKKPVDDSHSKPRLLGRAEMEQANAAVQIWPEVNRSKPADSFSPFLLRPDIKPDFDGLYTISSPDQSSGAVVTPYHKIKVTDGKESYESSLSVGRVYGNSLQQLLGVKDGDYVMVMLVASEKGIFTASKNVSITLTLGKEKVNLVSFPKFKRQLSEGVLEELAFKVDKATFNKLAKSESIKLALGKYSGSAEKPVIASVKSLKEREL